MNRARAPDRGNSQARIGAARARSGAAPTRVSRIWTWGFCSRRPARRQDEKAGTRGIRNRRGRTQYRTSRGWRASVSPPTPARLRAVLTAGRALP